MPDNISLEPLFNDGRPDVAGGGGARVTSVEEIGAASNRTAITVNDVAQQITITAGKTAIEIENSGSSIIYYGGSGVNSSNGLRLFPNSKKVFTKVKSNFSLYVVTATGETSTLRIGEYA